MYNVLISSDDHITCPVKIQRNSTKLWKTILMGSNRNTGFWTFSIVRYSNKTENTMFRELDLFLSSGEMGDTYSAGSLRFVVGKMALGQVFSEYFGFPCQFSFHRLFHTHLSSRSGTIGQRVADVPSGLSLAPHQEI
jgi:hypothetical protein